METPSFSLEVTCSRKNRIPARITKIGEVAEIREASREVVKFVP